MERKLTVSWEDPKPGAEAARTMGVVEYLRAISGGELPSDPFAVHTTLPAGTGYTTPEIKVNLLRPITVDTGRLLCEGKR
ncbi:MAG: hypothetical protein ACRDSJ_18175 [Rubrobacteraceae bacterium]